MRCSLCVAGSAVSNKALCALPKLPRHTGSWDPAVTAAEMSTVKGGSAEVKLAILRHFRA